MEPARCTERADKLRRLSEQNSSRPLLRDGYLQLARELEQKAALLRSAKDRAR